MKTRFTLFDVVAILLIVPLVVTLFLSTRIGPRGEVANYIKCASNLRQIGQALMMYSTAQRNGAYPRTRYDSSALPTAFTNPAATQPFAADGPAVNDVTAALYLLLRTQEVAPEVFTCPSSNDLKEPSSAYAAASNFSNPRHLSYSYTNPYPSMAAVASGWKLNSSIRAEFAVASDVNPGNPELMTVGPNSSQKKMESINSPNHDGEGQNVLYGDGHVDWNRTPFCGTAMDNIFLSGGPPDRKLNLPATGTMGIIGPSFDANDSILLPIRPGPTRSADALRRDQIAFAENVLKYVAWIVLIAAIAWLAVWRWTNFAKRWTANRT